MKELIFVWIIIGLLAVLFSFLSEVVMSAY
jgi:hypothetical protein